MEELQKFFKVNVSSDKMKATISLIEPLPEEMVVSENDLLRLLEENKVKYGIDHETIQNLVGKLKRDRFFQGAVVVAKGLAPKKGQDAYLLPVQLTKERKID